MVNWLLLFVMDAVNYRDELWLLTCESEIFDLT